MNNIKETVANWLAQPQLDEELKKELLLLTEAQQYEAFYADLAFGTGGMRGIIGVGTNRMNKYVIRRASYGFCQYLIKRHPDALERGIVISYDCRNKSLDFAYETALTFASLGVKTYLFQGIRPTPELSFMVKHLHCVGGVMVTASHNPPQYNGYKIYDEDGCQLVPALAEQVIELIDQVTDPFSIENKGFQQLQEQGVISFLGADVDQAYLDKVMTVKIQKVDPSLIKVVFTPLHGTAAVHLPKLMRESGYQVICVEEQMIADPNFSTVKSPNPEDTKAFEYAEVLGIKENADLLIATDPDADRMGVGVNVGNGKYVYLTGNQTGAILLNYLAKFKKRGPKANVYNTIVSSNIAQAICKKYGLNLIQTLTGFKFIGEQAKLIENTDEMFFFGYEESYGYVVEDFVRDKDSLQSSLLLLEVAAYYKNIQMTLVDALNEIYAEFGFYQDGVENIYLEGAEGVKRIGRIMKYFQSLNLSEAAGKKIVTIEDYEQGVRKEQGKTSRLTLPYSSVLKYIFDDGGWFVLRPSGTEPKLKIYISIVDENKESAQNFINRLSKIILALINEVA